MSGMNGSYRLENVLRSIEGHKTSTDRFFKITDALRPRILKAINEGLKRKLEGDHLADFVAYIIAQAINNYDWNNNKNNYKEIEFPEDRSF